MINITIIGTGYVGSVTGACLADFGNKVICIDNNPEKIEAFKNGIIPIYEPGLSEVVIRNIKSGRLEFSGDLAAAVKKSKVVFIAVGTPPLEDGSADLCFVESAAREIAAAMDEYTIIVNKSTVPIGTVKRVGSWIKEELEKNGKNIPFDVLSNPEFLREGTAVYDFTHPDRVVLGSSSASAMEILKNVYRPLYLNETPFVETSPETAEMIKYASNAFLATKITFINEIANLCEKTGANVQEVAKAMGKDGRIGSKFLHPGPGYGGSCFPKDTRALAKTGQDFGEPVSLVEAVISANEKQKNRQVAKIEAALGGKESLEKQTIAVLGLSYKSNTNDMRDAPSITICRELASKGAKLRVYDPAAMEEAKRIFSSFAASVFYAADEYDALSGSGAVAIVTDWHQFRNMDLNRIKETMTENPCFFDLRNIYKRKEVEEAGFRYWGVGK